MGSDRSGIDREVVRQKVLGSEEGVVGCVRERSRECEQLIPCSLLKLKQQVNLGK